jgi:hypothetical protein
MTAVEATPLNAEEQAERRIKEAQAAADLKFMWDLSRSAR